jgi:hypothetical protein
MIAAINDENELNLQETQFIKSKLSTISAKNIHG